MNQKRKISLMLVIILVLQTIFPIIINTKVVAIEEVNLGEEQVVNNSKKEVDTNLQTIKFGSYANENKEIEGNAEEIVKETTTVLENTENISEAYLEWAELSDEEKQKTIQPREEHVEMSILDDFVTSSSSIPTAYNLRDRINIKTENQNPYGNCYAYASLNSIETNIALKSNTEYDFSEMHVEYMTSNLLEGNRTLNEGGNFQTVVNYSKDLFGPVLESEIANKTYTEDEYTLLRSAKPIVTITETVEFPTINKRYGYTEEQLEEFRTAVKTHIRDNGSVYASMYFSESNKYYDSSTKGYCCLDTSIMTNHAVSIIGWDDNFSKDNFPESNRPINNGAWIALNSHGSSFGDDGVFYISYEDNWIEYNMSGVVSTIEFVDSYGPEVELINYTDENNTISSTINVYDIGGSGIDTDNLKYVWSQSEYEPDIEEFTESFTNGSTLTKEYEDGEKWYLWILAYDNNGNYSIYGEGVKTVKFNDNSLYKQIKQKLSDGIKECNDETYEIKVLKSELDQITFINVNYMIDDLSGLEMFENLEALSFGTSSEFKSQDILQQLDKLKKLSIECGYGLSDIKFIENLNTLEYLYLSKLTDLKDINIDFPDNIKELSIWDCDKLENVNANYPEQLVVLRISNCDNLTDISNISFPNGLEQIRIVNNSIRDISNIYWPDNLKYLSLQDNDIELVNGSVWPNTLEILDLSLNSINDITSINLPSGLIELYIGGNEIIDISNLSNLTNLQLFSAGANYIENISVIENMQKLEKVYLGSIVWWCYYFWNGEGPYGNIVGYERDHGNNISNIKINWPESIVKIELDNNKIENALEVNWPVDLEELYLENNLIENISIEMGQYFNTLYLDNNKIKDISKIIISNTCTTKDGNGYRRGVSLDNNKIENIPVEIWENSEIHTLILSNNNISNIDNVVWPQGLDSLTLYNNKISSLNNVDFASSLRYLILNNNDISEINNIAWPDRLKAIELAGNNITDLSWIESGTNLMAVALNNNKIKNIENLSVLSKLQELHLDYNNIEDVEPIENLSSLSKFSVKNQAIIRVVKGSTESIEIPSIIKSSNQTSSKVYSSNSFGLINCKSEDNELVFSSDNIGDIFVIITMGKASGTIVYITDDESVDCFESIEYRVYTKEDLLDIREVLNNSDISDIKIELMNDIDLGGYFNQANQSWEGEQWIPLGNEAHPFKCIFNGNGHKISGIYIDSSGSYQGFIGYNEGIINNLGIENGYIKGESMIGGIAGQNDGEIIECYNKSNIEGFSNVGGISGFGGTISGNARIEKCYNSGIIKASYAYAAGILGQAMYAIKVAECYNTGVISSNGYVAGIVASLNGSGYTSNGTLEINNCFNLGEINGTNAGGIISDLATMNGEYQGHIKNCYNIGQVRGTKSSGAIKGTKGINARVKDRNIKNCYYLKEAGLNAIGNEDDMENNVYGLDKEFMKTAEFVNLLNVENEVWKLAEVDYKYPVLSWQTTYPDFTDDEESILLTEITVTKVPDNTTYIEGQNFNPAGMIVTATYNDGSTKEVTNYIVIDGNNLTAGKTSVTISYTENGVTKTATQGINVTEKLQIEINEYTEKEEGNITYIENVFPNTTIEEMISKIDTNGQIEIFKGTEKITNNNVKIATGMKIKISLNNEYAEYTVVVRGDLTGDGEVGDVDLLRMARYKAGLDNKLSEAYLRAADINNNSEKADDIDLLKLVRILVGLDKF